MNLAVVLGTEGFERGHKKYLPSVVSSLFLHPRRPEVHMHATTESRSLVVCGFVVAVRGHYKPWVCTSLPEHVSLMNTNIHVSGQ